MMNTASKVVCVGRNYAEHAKELGNAIPEQPVLFIKPPSAIAPITQGIRWQKQWGECHFECELCLRIDRPLSGETDQQTVLQAVGAVTLGLDLTLRDLQNQLKQKGQPWERAKAFDGACILADWVDVAEISDWQDIQFDFYQNGTLKQHGNTVDMLFDVAHILIEINQVFSLQPGDVIMTGTPKGVSALHANDQLKMILQTQKSRHEWSAYCADF